MLAVQRPRMGSSKPPNPDMPFGYSFDNVNSGYPFPSPPMPAPGPSLLDDNESKLLDSFFDDVSQDQYNGDFFSAGNDGLVNMSFNWQDLPPAFMGTSSSFGQQQTHTALSDLSSMTYPDLNGHMSLPGGIPPSTTADVLAAATLLQNGHNSRSHSMVNDSVFAAPNMLPSHPRGQNAQMMPYTYAHSRISVKPDDFTRDTFYTELMFGSAANDGRQDPKGPSKAVDIRWGSDAGFGSGQGFVAPPGQETVESVEQSKLNVLDCLEPHNSTAASTRPSSPILTRYTDIHRRQSTSNENDRDNNGPDDNERPKKRRRSKMKDEDEDDDDNGILSKAPRKRRPKSMAAPTAARSSTLTQSPPPSKRRKSASSSAAKPNRENLTEDQKRENHIKSEQKRRTLIKEGFDDLGELVPDLRSGGFSKSAVLVMTADFLEDLIKGNEILRARLGEIEGSR